MEELLDNDAPVEQKPRRSSLLRYLMYVLYFLIMIIVMIIVANIVYKIRIGSEDKVKTNIMQSEVEQKRLPLESFSIGMIEINLNDPSGLKPMFIRMELALGMDPKGNIALRNELVARRNEIRDMILSLVSSKTYEEINTSDKRSALKQEIIMQVNNILIDGFIEDVYIIDFTATSIS